MLFSSRQGKCNIQDYTNCKYFNIRVFLLKTFYKERKNLLSKHRIYCPNTRCFSSAVSNRARFRESMCSTTCFDSVYRSRQAGRAAPCPLYKDSDRRYHSVPIVRSEGEVVRGSRLGFHQQTLPPPCRHHFAAIINFSHKH